MSNVTTDAATIALLNSISSELNRYITLFVFIFGTIGNLLNILIFSQASLRTNPCVVYFLSSSVSSLGILLIGLPSRLIAGWISTDPTNTNSLLCKFRIFLLYGFRTTAVWLFVFATIDRWFLSSETIRRRRLSSLKFAYKSLTIIHCCSFLLWFESLFCYNIDVPQSPLRCYGRSHQCRIFNDLVYATSTVIIPSFLLLIFGLQTIHNINRTRRAIEPFIATIAHIEPLNIKKRKKRRRNQSSLTRMLLLQIVFLTIFSLPQAIHQIYLTLTVQIVKSPFRLTIESFIVNFNFSLTYVGNASPFYVYTLTGTMFRQELIQMIRSLVRQGHAYISRAYADFKDDCLGFVRSRRTPS